MGRWTAGNSAVAPGPSGSTAAQGELSSVRSVALMRGAKSQNLQKPCVLLQHGPKKWPAPRRPEKSHFG
eukprot:11210769-Lingulodinium_polyedra.AAC.1